MALPPTRVVVLGLLVLQVAWIFAVPPFRGIDEFDHAYKAIAVAEGDWLPSPSSATRGTGAWLEVPSELVEAARAQCEALSYTNDEDCVGVPDGETTRVASGAGRYNPFYYALVGPAGALFDGASAVYAMRIMSALLCTLMFGAALVASRRWAQSNWPPVALTIAATPVLVYSSAVLAPNGLEMMAGLAFWAGFLGLALGKDRVDGSSLWIAVVAGVVLVTTRSLGPLWCLMIVLTVPLVLGRALPSRARELVRDRRVLAGGTLVVIATALSALWTIRMGSLDVGSKPDHVYSFGERLEFLRGEIPLWMFQSIAAFPLRNEPTEPVVYICYLVLFLGIVALGLRAATPWVKAALLITITLSLLVPLAISFATLNDHIGVWQGRYTLPYSAGIVILAALALDRAGSSGMGPRTRLVGLLLYVTAHAVGPVTVLRLSEAKPLSDADAWIHPPGFIVGVIAALGAALLWWSITERPRELT